MQDLWEKTKIESFPQGIDTWRVDYRTPSSQSKGKEQGASTTVERPDTDGEDVKVVVEKFRARYPTTTLELSDEATVLPMTLKVSGMAFYVKKETENEVPQYRIETRPGPKTSKVSDLQVGIVNSVENRNTKDNLSDLLVSSQYLRNLSPLYGGILIRIIGHADIICQCQNSTLRQMPENHQHPAAISCGPNKTDQV